MRRVLKPGGLLLLTTHGLTSIGDFVRRNMLRRRDAARLPRAPRRGERALQARCRARAAARPAHALLRGEHAFQPRFGSGGDWGVVDPEWGMGYMTPEWLLPRVRAGWKPLLHEPGRPHANQNPL